MDTNATNTLIIPDVPADILNSQAALEKIREIFASYQHLHSFIVLKGFKRLMVIYSDTTSALRAKQELDQSTLHWKKEGNDVTILSNDNCIDDANKLIIRIYFGQHNPLSTPGASSLKVPQAERNFLISPPGVPFDNWVQKTESPPNTAVLASDLSHSMTALHEPDDDFSLDDMANREEVPSVLTVICSDGEKDKELPLITVEDCSPDTSDTQPRPRMRPVTPYPWRSPDSNQFE